MVSLLQEAVEHDGTSGFTEQSQFSERVFGVLGVAVRIHPNQDHVFEAKLAVFHLGDVFEFSG